MRTRTRRRSIGSRSANARRVGLPLAFFCTLALPGCADAQATLEGLPHREIRQEISLGAFDDPVLAFSRISDLAIGPDGLLYIVQPAEGNVTVLDARGSLVRRIGRPGRGPGEFATAASLGWFADSLWVLDIGARRVSYYLDGEVVRTEPYQYSPVTPRGESLLATFPLANGTFLGVLALRTRPSPEAPRVDHTARLVVLAPTGAITDTVASLRESYPLQLYVGRTATSPLYHDFPLFRVSRRGDFVVVVDRPFATTGSLNHIRLTRLAADGDTVFSRVLESRAVELTDRLWEDRIEWRAERLPGSSIDRDAYLAASRRPPSLPSVSALAVGQDGWIWLGREEVPGRGVVEWVGLDDQGMPRFRFDLPSGFRVFDAGPSGIWGIQLDALDVPHIVRYTFAEPG